MPCSGKKGGAEQAWNDGPRSPNVKEGKSATPRMEQWLSPAYTATCAALDNPDEASGVIKDSFAFARPLRSLEGF